MQFNHSNNRLHFLSLCDRSIVPALTSVVLRAVLILFNRFLNRGFSYYYRWFTFTMIWATIFGCCSLWCYLIRFEVRFHTIFMAVRFRIRFTFFLISERFLFFRFFWTYFHFAWSVDYKTGGFPNKYIVFVDPWTAPFFNTMVLISSRFSLTFAHVSLIAGSYDGCVCRILSCLAQGITFTWYQWKEYLTARFCINNRSFASIFYMATRFHRAHVQIGTRFIIYNLFRLSRGEWPCTKWRHVRFRMGVWYWHFVDVIWIFLFCIIYVLN